jgi:uncharacterized protein VirK/YbjX
VQFFYPQSLPPNASRFWARFHETDPRKLARAALLVAWHWRCMRVLCAARPNSALGRLLAARPEIWGVVLTPYLAASWSARERVGRVVDHCATIEQLGALLDCPLDAFVDLLRLDEIDSAYRVVLDQPRWLLRDGQSTISLWEGCDRLFSLSFCLSSQGGDLVAYVGGLQGRQEEGVLDRYRRFTKLAHGIRPSDITVELFRMICAGFGISRILAVSDSIQHQRSSYSVATLTESAVHLRYDILWEGRGGCRRPDGFYDVPVAPQRRGAADIPANKRALYRRRYAALDAIAARMDAVVRSGLKPGMLGYHCGEAQQPVSQYGKKSLEAVTGSTL